jgi:hypothetical protein
MSEDVLDLLPRRRGHFLLESGHHGELWLDLPNPVWEPAVCPLCAQGQPMTASEPSHE